jgi:monomeric sarcosine oxidase
VNGKTKFDIIVIGAGVFGSWTANILQRSGRRVLILDAYGPANSRASSGGESRIIRMGYGADELYTRWSMRSLPAWEELDAITGARIFHRTGVLWLSPNANAYTHQTLEVLKKTGVPHEVMNADEVRRRYPQISIPEDAIGFLEMTSGTIMARRAVELVVADAVRKGAAYLAELIEAPSGKGRLQSVCARNDEHFSADTFVFACGPWLPQIFPTLLGDRIFPTRQEVFFFGVPPGDGRFSPPALPTFLDRYREYYGMPSLEGRGLKAASDEHGGRANPDSQERIPTAEATAHARKYVAERFPALKNAPIVETRICQYENTSSGDFLIDRHPDFENVWLVGGGSGHGFKHGPALGEYVTERVNQGGAVEPRFSLATKQTVKARAVY